MLEASNKALSHLLLLCPSLCLWGGVKGVLKEDKPMPCVCVCVDPELQEFGALGTQQAGGWGCVPVLGSVPAPAPLRHGLAVNVPSSLVQRSLLAQEPLARPQAAALSRAVSARQCPAARPPSPPCSRIPLDAASRNSWHCILKKNKPPSRAAPCTGGG